MSRKSPFLLKILNDTLDLMTLMTHARRVLTTFDQHLLWINRK